MKIKTIQAKTFREALSLVRKELGEEAVILSSEDKKGGNPYVQITAAVDFETEIHYTQTSQLSTAINKTNGDKTGSFVEIKNEITSLRKMLESMKNSGYEITMQGERKQMFNFLKEKSIKEEFAVKLIEKVKGIDDIEAVMSEEINIARPKSKNIIMLIGPTGVGKTTTIAKLAAKAVKERKRVALISIDTYKIGAVEHIRIYSKMLGIPLDIVSDTAGMRKSIKKYYDRDLLLIDTTGKNPRESEYIDLLKDAGGIGFPIETQLLLSTSSDCDFLMESYKYYSALPVDCIAFTKTDEAVKLGSIYNLILLYQKPVAYITTGQRVPDDIEFVNSRRLTELVLGMGRA